MGWNGLGKADGISWLGRQYGFISLSKPAALSAISTFATTRNPLLTRWAYCGDPSLLCFKMENELESKGEQGRWFLFCPKDMLRFQALSRCRQQITNKSYFGKNSAKFLCIPKKCNPGQFKGGSNLSLTFEPHDKGNWPHRSYIPPGEQNQHWRGVMFHVLHACEKPAFVNHWDQRNCISIAAEKWQWSLNFSVKVGLVCKAVRVGEAVYCSSLLCLPSL